MGDMQYKRFLFFNVIGAFLWAVLIPILGFYLGSVIPGVDRYLLPILALIIILSISPTVIHLIRERKGDSELKEAVEETRKEIETIVKK